jgi:two-component system sensor histidine kinase NreB
VAQEGLNNVTRHSGAHAVALSLHHEATKLLLQVTDDGRGFVPGAPDHAIGLGLHSAAERVRSVGGTLTVDSAPGAGTTLRVVVPVVVIPVREANDASAAHHPRG